ncbi:hypothetical protein EG359_07000 [Chryseobacterium joostei]|uniref:Transposase n=1 Tax=Chryseobacterium joostei TaxID=112234 RepID=A0ABM7BJJ5_9FLAO|nr:hypothetical protein EG359_07000 [Chryseobacterium joostei]
MIHQKINYVHQNPVEAGLVFCEEDYTYTIARDYSDEKGFMRSGGNYKGLYKKIDFITRSRNSNNSFP